MLLNVSCTIRLISLRIQTWKTERRKQLNISLKCINSEICILLKFLAEINTAGKYVTDAPMCLEMNTLRTKKIIFIPITITVCLDHLLFLVAPVACSFGCNMGKCQDQYKLWVLSPLCGCFFYLFPKCFLCTVFRYNEKKMKNKRKALVQYLGFGKWSSQNPGNSKLQSSF